jgi:DNA (cytosine-5)-methyltransferase 1
VSRTVADVTRPLLLDLFCCEGGAAMGYHRAGFDVIGVDIKPQPLYPFTFVQADVLGADVKAMLWPERFDAIHASPPCQAYSQNTQTTPGAQSRHPDLVGQTRSLLEATGLPYVIENVEGAPLRRDLLLCGSMFGLQTRRHRVFEFGGWLMLSGLQCAHRRQGRTVDVTGNPGGRNATDRKGYPIKYRDAAHAREVMEMPWASGHGCTQAIPPAYTEWIGRQLIAQLKERAA